MKAAAALLLLCALLACPAAATAEARAPAPAFEHVVVIVFENKESASILGNPAARTFNYYARRYANLTRYFGVTHPSLPNYLALVSGSTHGITSNCTSCVASGKSLADTIEESGRTWKTYAEGLPSAGYLGPSSRRYAKKHDPFAYFQAVSADPQRRARIVPLTRLAVDLHAGALPDFSLIVPDLCHSMHDCAVGVGDAWLRRIAPPLLSLPDSVVFVVFDEGSSRIRGGGHTVALALGTAIRRHARFTRITNHYGLLRTIEQAWGLPLLGRSAGATPITGIWR
jgi:phosphatidylinositol-3-phosphatase